MFQIGENIKTVRQVTDLNQKGFAEVFGIVDKNGRASQDILSNYETGRTTPPVELVRQLAKAAGIDPKRFATEYVSIDDIVDVTFPGKLSDEAEASSFSDTDDENKNVLNDDGGNNVDLSNHSLAQAILKIANSNELLAKSHFNFSESNRTLAENNKELIQMLKSPASAPAETPEVVLPNIADFLEVIAELASGEMKYKSKNEAAAELHRRFFSRQKKAS